MTCMGNSGPLRDDLTKEIEDGDLAVAAVLSGNRNFEGRVHAHVRANFSASPPLVVAFALAGSVRRDITSEPLGADDQGKPVYLRELWPSDEEVRTTLQATLTPEMFRSRYANVFEGSEEWRGIDAGGSTRYAWPAASTFIRRPPFFENMQPEPPPVEDIRGARVLAMFGDMLTTDHISPIGVIPSHTSAGQYLISLGIEPKDFSNYASRRTNHEVMIRGTFANIRLRNEMTPQREGGFTRLMPGGEEMTIFDAAERYRSAGVPLVIVAGAEYGAGSSRDWAAKGTRLLGVKAVIAESFERIHRSNLIGMGVLPLQLAEGVTRKTLRLDGSETFDLTGLTGPTPGLKPRMQVSCTITRQDGSWDSIKLTARLDTLWEVEYYRHGGILHYVVRNRLGAKAVPTTQSVD
jgi:aconitate hydratase